MDVTVNDYVAVTENKNISRRHAFLKLVCLSIFTLYLLSSYFNLPFRWSPILFTPDTTYIDHFESLLQLTPNYTVDISRRYASLLLSEYEHRLAVHSNAAFLPEIAGSHLFLHVRLPQFLRDIAHIHWLTHNPSRILTLFIFCYEVLIAIPVCNISLVMNLTTNETMNVLYYAVRPSFLTPSQTLSGVLDLQISTNSVKIRAPFHIFEGKSYRFMYQIHEDSPLFSSIGRKPLYWPVWPLTTECAKRYLQQIIFNKNKTEYDNVSTDSCVTTTILTVFSPQQAFENERTSISSWLDAQYRASSSGVFDSTKRRSKQAFENAPETSMCPLAFQNWILDYQHWHANITRQLSEPYQNLSEMRNRILQQNIRFMFCVHFDSGMADRFAHLISTYLVAILTRRFFVFDSAWSDFYNVMQLSLGSEQENASAWIADLPFINSNLSQNHTEYISQRLAVFKNERIFQEFDYEKEYPEHILHFKSHIGNVIHTVTSPKSIYRQFLQTNLSITSDIIYGCLYHSLMVPRLSTLVRFASLPVNTSFSNQSLNYQPHKILQLLLSPRYYPIGIQIRLGDHVMLEKSNTTSLLSHWMNGTFLSNVGGFFTCAAKIIQNHVNGRNKRIPFVFLISDSYIVRREALLLWSFDKNYSKTKIYKNIHVITSSDSVSHITYTQNSLSSLRQAIFESFLFSICEQHIITTNSGFGRFAAFASMKRKNLYSLQVGEQSICTSITLTEAGHQYSGIR